MRVLCMRTLVRVLRISFITKPGCTGVTLSLEVALMLTLAASSTALSEGRIPFPRVAHTGIIVWSRNSRHLLSFTSTCIFLRIEAPLGHLDALHLSLFGTAIFSSYSYTLTCALVHLGYVLKVL